MQLLAINSSGFSGTAAIFADGVWQEIKVPANQATAKHLVPVIADLADSCGINLSGVSLFAVTSGPGSFTGLRIGITICKSLAYAYGAKCTGINSLASIAENARRQQLWTSGNLTVVMNAYRKQFFVATFVAETFNSDSLIADRLTEVIAAEKMPAHLDGDSSLITGPGLEALLPTIAPDFRSRVVEFPQWDSAIGTGEIAIRMKSVADDFSPMALVPHYFRQSAAEENLPSAK